MLFPKVLTLFFQNTIIFISASFLQDQIYTKTIKIDRFDGKFCGKKVPLESSYIGIKSGATSMFIPNSTVRVTEDLVGKPKMTISIKRCKSRENLDSCEEFHEMRDLDYCQSINPDGLLAQSPFVFPYQPKYKCPIKKGIYHAYNFTVNLTPFLFFKLDGWYWRIRINLISPKENNRLLGCLNSESYTVLNPA